MTRFTERVSCPKPGAGGFGFDTLASERVGPSVPLEELLELHPIVEPV